MDRRQRRQRILQPVRRAGGQAERDRLAADFGDDIPALAAGGVLQFLHIGSLAEANHPAAPFRRCQSAGNTSTPSSGRPCAMLTFSRRIASRLPSFSRCTGCTLTTSATVGLVSSLSRAISPDWFMPISTTHRLAAGTGIAQRQRHAPEIVEAARAGIGVRIGGEELLGAGLAGAAGQADHRAIEPRTRARAPSFHKPSISVSVDDELGHAHAIDAMRNDHRHRAGGLGLVGEFPAVARAGETGNEAAARRPAQRHEQASRLDQAAVLRDEVDRRIRKCVPQARAHARLRRSSTMAQRFMPPSLPARPRPPRDR